MECKRHDSFITFYENFRRTEPVNNKSVVEPQEWLEVPATECIVPFKEQWQVGINLNSIIVEKCSLLVLRWFFVV